MNLTQTGHQYFDKVSSKWAHDEYKQFDLAQQYPANQFRLQIFKNLLRAKLPQKLLDVGCGSGDPLLEFLKMGIDAKGFDFADSMVELAKHQLELNGHLTQRVSKNNMESPTGYLPESFDCLVALGSLYYANSFAQALTKMTELITPGGRFIFSLRNDLFSLFSQNKYTLDFLFKSLIDSSTLPLNLVQPLKQDFEFYEKKANIDRKFLTIDDLNVHTTYHNPLTISSLLLPYGLTVQGIYFYHYHAIPPKYEHIDPLAFRKASLKIEKADDWRGHFLASCFIVDAVKSKP